MPNVLANAFTSSCCDVCEPCPSGIDRHHGLDGSSGSKRCALGDGINLLSRRGLLRVFPVVIVDQREPGSVGRASPDRVVFAVSLAPGGSNGESNSHSSRDLATIPNGRRPQWSGNFRILRRVLVNHLRVIEVETKSSIIARNEYFP